MLRIGIVLGSTRPNRNGEQVARWIEGLAARRGDAQFEWIDLKEVGLPFLDEPLSPAMGRYAKPHTRAWAARVAALDGFIFVTPEYNHGIPAALKNAIDFVYAEWNDKAAAFVSYGSAGGVRAVESLRLVMGEVKIADVRAQVALSLHTDFENMSVFKPARHHEKSAGEMLDQLIAWSRAMRTIREPARELEEAAG